SRQRDCGEKTYRGKRDNAAHRPGSSKICERHCIARTPNSNDFLLEMRNSTSTFSHHCASIPQEMRTVRGRDMLRIYTAMKSECSVETTGMVRFVGISAKTFSRRNTKVSRSITKEKATLQSSSHGWGFILGSRYF